MRNSSQGLARFCGSVERQLGGRNMSPASALDARRIGSIGLGKMGLPICERLATQGFAVTALTRNPEGGSAPPAQTFRANPKLAVWSPAPIPSFPPLATPPSARHRVQGWRTKKTLHASQIFVDQHTLSGCLPASRRTDVHDWGGIFDRLSSTLVRACIRSQPNHEGS
jgi:NAD binding domain of 6-phosphogluconate dehydrogenase